MVPRRSTEDTPNPDHTQGEVPTIGKRNRFTFPRPPAAHGYRGRGASAGQHRSASRVEARCRRVARHRDRGKRAGRPRSQDGSPGDDPGVQARLTTHQARGECGMIVLP